VANVFATLTDKRIRLMQAVCAVALVVSGCSSGHDYGPTGTVSGRLLYKGQPLTPGTAVVFKNLTTGHACMGATGQAGDFRLDSWNNGNVPVGKYEVMIQPPAAVDPETIDPQALIDNPELMESTRVKFDFPQKYSHLASSGLNFEVKEGPNEYQIELVD